VVLAAGGYPGDYARGMRITGLDASLPDTKVFHAGTVLKDGEYQTSGGRVLCVVGLGKSVRGAQEKAYARVQQIAFDGMQFRKDIGYRAVARESIAKP
jgi:phosphoribosylamine--glycine ligase